MINAAPASWTPPASSEVRAAFATLERAQQRLLDAALFDGQTCARIARSIGAAALDIRRRLAAALLALHAQLGPSNGGAGGAVAAMLALRALDALDPDEAELIDAMLAQQPALHRSYAGYQQLVAELCTLVPPIAPSRRALARLCDAIGDDTAN